MLARYEFASAGRTRLGYRVQPDTTATDAAQPDRGGLDPGGFQALQLSHRRRRAHRALVRAAARRGRRGTDIGPAGYAVLVGDEVGIRVRFSAAPSRAW
ncbi:hypothetical protein ABZ805_23960 [Saccharopolyspora sp. NPDC047091]|uniref:hypothetical protein n=1 Tax=Saccharopolyspora sp. NPDC047091 TaxID=3155924 RepID=UPI00340380A1